MKVYHGAKLEALNEIKAGKVDVTIGGGELGRGFYCGDLLHRAKTWSFNKHKCFKVAKIEFEDDDFLNLQPLLLNKSEATEFREQIKQKGETRTYLFNENAVWSPVVGLPSDDFNQIKWETDVSEKFLNGENVLREII